MSRASIIKAIIAALAVCALALWIGLAHGQGLPEPQQPNPVTTWPVRGSSTGGNASSSIASGGVYQQVFASSLLRKACTVQNTGGHTEWVFFGPIASATHGTSISLAPGTAVYCNNGPVVLTDQVSIDGTTSDTFFAAQQ